MRSGDFADALADYDKALQIMPNYTQACFNKGIAFIKLNDTDRACSSWNQALAFGAQPAAALIKAYCGKPR